MYNLSEFMILWVNLTYCVGTYFLSFYYINFIIKLGFELRRKIR